MTVPEKRAPKAKKKKRVNPNAGSFDVMDELLKEANVKSAARVWIQPRDRLAFANGYV